MSLPKPKKKMTNKGPKPCNAALITSSPYKNNLQMKKEEQKQKEIKKKEREDLKKQKDQKKQKRDRKDLKIATKRSCKRKLKLDDSEPDDIKYIDSGELVMDMEFGVENPEKDDAVCLFCESLFSDDIRESLTKGLFLMVRLK
ncbi:hypothetical protein FQR65_LT11651 [Abscondita terminalis]|nr:hypothetical protein FQR65_LT11651 [Abscondita terminalis]